MSSLTANDYPLCTRRCRMSKYCLGSRRTGLFLSNAKCSIHSGAHFQFVGAPMTWRTVSVHLELLPTAASGRLTPIASGYRSLLRFEGSTIDFGFELKLDSEADSNGLSPGSSGNGQISFWAAEDLPSLSQGTPFEIREGQKTVALGFISAP